MEVHRGGTGPPAAQRAGGRLGRRVKAEVCGCRLQLQRVKESAAPGKGGREGGTWCASGRATEAQAAVGARGAESAGQYALEWVGGAAKRGGAGTRRDAAPEREGLQLGALGARPRGAFRQPEVGGGRLKLWAA